MRPRNRVLTREGQLLAALVLGIVLVACTGIILSRCGPEPCDDTVIHVRGELVSCPHPHHEIEIKAEHVAVCTCREDTNQ